MLEAQHITCVRGDRSLFAGLSFRVEAGTALRLGGANGAGKTSLLRLLCGLAVPAEGDILWHGHGIRKRREEFHRDLMYVGHASAVKDDLSALENLLISTTVCGHAVEAADALQALERIGLAGREDLPARFLSQGQRRRVVLARLLLSVRTPLWILDEPFTALDVKAVEQLRRVVEEHLRTGGIAIFTTHQEVPLDGRLMKVDLDEVAAC